MRHTSETTNVDSTFYPNLGSYGIRLPEIEGGLLSGLASGWLDKEVAKAKGTRFTLPRCKLLVNWGGAKEVFGPDSRRDGNSNSSCEMSGASASTYEHAQWSFHRNWTLGLVRFTTHLCIFERRWTAGTLRKSRGRLFKVRTKNITYLSSHRVRRPVRLFDYL